MKLFWTLISILFLMIPAVVLQAATIRVPSDQPTIQAGIDASVSGDTVLVADGTWTGDGNRDIDFMGKAITVASENGPESCIVDCDATEVDHHRGFYFHRGEGRGSLLVGFTIEKGFVGGASASGGGILCEGASPVIQGNVIRVNTSDSKDIQGEGGGGIACFSASPLISGNVISSNLTNGLNGGGIFCEDGSAPIITGNTIEGNIVNTYGGHGGGIYARRSLMVIRRNIIRNNDSGISGNCIYCQLCETEILGNQITENRGTAYAVALWESTGSFSSNILSGNFGGLKISHENFSSITDNYISNNRFGGLSVSSCSPMISNNIINGNSSGIRCSYTPSPTILQNTISGNNGSGIKISGEGSSPLISANRIFNNSTSTEGGGIFCAFGTGMTLFDNIIQGNTAGALGGGIYCYGATEVIIGKGNVISGNTTNLSGGGLHLSNCGLVEIDSSRITDNRAAVSGGGIMLAASSSLSTSNVLITGNQADNHGGGLYATMDSTLTVDICTISANEAILGGGCFTQGIVGISGSIVYGNLGENLHGQFTVRYSDIGGGWPGQGNLGVDPLFVSGPLGSYYLSQTAAGQPTDSPCVDMGDHASVMIEGTTRTDLELDNGIIDMGYHGPLEMPSSLVAGPGPAFENPPLARVFPPWQDAVHMIEFCAYGSPHYGLNVTTGKVTGDEADTILTGAGPGETYGPHVRGFRPDGTPLPGLSFLAYGTSKWGVNVAAGNIDGDGYDEIITGAGPGAVFGPHVRGWDYDDTGSVTAMTGVSYFAYGTPKWGVNVSAGNIDGDGYDEIITGAGQGSVYGPHVRGWNYDDTAIAPIPAVSFMAYGTYQYGVNVSCGDVDGDGIDEIVTAPGPGVVFGAHIRGWNYDGDTVTPLDGLSFMAWPYPEYRYGALVFAGADLDGDGLDDLVVGGGPDPASGTPVSAYRYDGMQTSFWFSLEAFEGMTHGVNVAAGRI